MQLDGAALKAGEGPVVEELSFLEELRLKAGTTFDAGDCGDAADADSSDDDPRVVVAVGAGSPGAVCDLAKVLNRLRAQGATVKVLAPS